jgi:hypothetical protein
LAEIQTFQAKPVSYAFGCGHQVCEDCLPKLLAGAGPTDLDDGSIDSFPLFDDTETHADNDVGNIQDVIQAARFLELRRRRYNSMLDTLCGNYLANRIGSSALKLANEVRLRRMFRMWQFKVAADVAAKEMAANSFDMDASSHCDDSNVDHETLQFLRDRKLRCSKSPFHLVADQNHDVHIRLSDGKRHSKGKGQAMSGVSLSSRGSKKKKKKRSLTAGGRTGRR